MGVTIDPRDPRGSMWMHWDLIPWTIQAGAAFWPATLLDQVLGESVFAPGLSMFMALDSTRRYWIALHGQ